MPRITETEIQKQIAEDRKKYPTPELQMKYLGFLLDDDMTDIHDTETCILNDGKPCDMCQWVIDQKSKNQNLIYDPDRNNPEKGGNQLSDDYW
jgi:hypothetical protein